MKIKTYLTVLVFFLNCSSGKSYEEQLSHYRHDKYIPQIAYLKASKSQKFECYFDQQSYEAFLMKNLVYSNTLNRFTNSEDGSGIQLYVENECFIDRNFIFILNVIASSFSMTIIPFRYPVIVNTKLKVHKEKNKIYENKIEERLYAHGSFLFIFYKGDFILEQNFNEKVFNNHTKELIADFYKNYNK